MNAWNFLKQIFGENSKSKSNPPVIENTAITKTNSLDSFIGTNAHTLAIELRKLPQYDWSTLSMNDQEIWDTSSETGSIIDKQFISKNVSADEAALIMLAKKKTGTFELMKLGEKLQAIQPYYDGRSVILFSHHDSTEGTPFSIGSCTTRQRFVIALRHSEKEFSILQYRYEHYKVIG